MFKKKKKKSSLEYLHRDTGEKKFQNFTSVFLGRYNHRRKGAGLC